MATSVTTAEHRECGRRGVGAADGRPTHQRIRQRAAPPPAARDRLGGDVPDQALLYGRDRGGASAPLPPFSQAFGRTDKSCDKFLPSAAVTTGEGHDAKASPAGTIVRRWADPLCLGSRPVRARPTYVAWRSRFADRPSVLPGQRRIADNLATVGIVGLVEGMLPAHRCHAVSARRSRIFRSTAARFHRPAGDRLRRAWSATTAPKPATTATTARAGRMSST